MKHERHHGQRVLCFDNRGATADRYTAVYLNQPERGRPGMFAAVGMSADPFAPQGFGQHITATPGAHLGRRVGLASLPADCQKLITQDLAGKTCQLLGVDAWRDGSGWSWNQWFKLERVPLAWCDLPARDLFRALREIHRLSAYSLGRVAREDDGYNVTILDRATRRPLFALEYGPEV